MCVYFFVFIFENICKKKEFVLKNRIVVDCNFNKKEILLDFRNKSLYRVLKFLYDLRK